MALSLLAYLLELLFGPLFLLMHLPELPAAAGEISTIVSGLAGGEAAAVVDGFLAGEYDVAGKTLASLVGTGLWLAVIAGTVGEFGEVAEVVEVFG